MKLLNFFKSRIFRKNLFFIGLLYLAIIMGGLKLMNIFTNHGINIDVPDLTGFSIEEVSSAFDSLDLRYEIIDSAAFNVKYPRGSIINQIPLPHAKVKMGRMIYLTVNPSEPRYIKLPNVIDMNKRQAVSYLETYGFKIGEFKYVPDLGRDVVLQVKFNGKEIQYGSKIKKFSRVDLVLGNGLSSEKIPVPNLLGLTIDSVKTVLTHLTLNIGAIRYQKTHDSINGFVFDQNPTSSLRNKIKLGNNIDLWITNDSSKLPNDSILNFMKY